MLNSAYNNDVSTHDAPTLEDAVEFAMEHRRDVQIMRRSKNLPHCFWHGIWLAAVYLDPKNFPHGLSKVERDSLIIECQKDGMYHPIFLISVKTKESGELYVAREKNLPDFDAWSRNNSR